MRDLFLCYDRVLMIPKQERLPLPEDSAPIPIAWVFMVKYVDDNPHILLAERTQGPEAGRLTFPGGVVEPGESPIDCARRELEEEVGFVIDEDYLIDAWQEPWTLVSAGHTYTLQAFFAFYDECTDESAPENLEPDKHSAWRWVSLNEAMALPVSGKLPHEIFRGLWLEVLEEITGLIREGKV
jgi:8-oxo-dGTP diphosphatase